MEIQVSPESASVESSTVVLVDQTLDAEIVYSEPLIQVHSGNNFVLSSEGQYSSNGLVGQIPKWILDAIEQKLSTGDGNIMSVVNDMKMLLDSLSIGVDQVVSELNTLSLSQNSLATSVSSQIQQDKAQIMNLLASKVDSDSATAIATQAIDSKFGGNVDSYIGNIASTYVDENSAIAQNIEVLRATLGDVSASVTDISSATVENVLNPLWIDDGNGTDPDINGNSKWILQAKAKKQLQVDANGVITGILLDSGQTSSITMTADQFKLVASGQSVASKTPFSVDATTGDIAFNGKVSFSSVTDVPQLGSTPQEVVDAVNAGSTTTIDGGNITTGSIVTSNLSTNIGLVNGYIYSSDFDGNTNGNIGSPTVGFRLSSTAAGTAVDPTIYGAYIKGGTIDGSFITGQFIDIQATRIFNPSFPGVYGRFFMSYSVYSVSTNIVFYGPNYSTGYLINRCIADTQIFDIQAYANLAGYSNGYAISGTIDIYVVLNGTASLIGTRSGSATFGSTSTGNVLLFYSLQYTQTMSGISTISFYYTVSASKATVSSSSLVVVTTNTI